MSAESQAPTSPSSAILHPGTPLYVDMDGTLVATDLLWESTMLFAARNPFEVWRVPLWLLGGKAHLKQQLTERAVPEASLLPYRQDVLDFLREEKRAGRRIILATAADERAARSVAAHVGLFDDTVASDGQRNLAGKNKLAAIVEHAEGEAFGYVGNSSADFPVWEKAQDAYVVAETSHFLRQAKRHCQPKRVFETKDGGFGAILKALRPNQWVKNVLLLVPVFAAHQITDLAVVMQALIAIACFCACASSVYITNDLLDLEGDRLHPRKRKRPFAAGRVSIPLGIAIAGALLVGGFAISALLLPLRFTLLLALYLALSSAYSFFLKRRMLQDVFVLAGLYTLRIIAGGAATVVEISPWLLAFAMFFFLSLAFLKRYAELLMVAERNDRQTSGRGYLTEDIAVIESVGPTSGYLAVMVLCLYLNSEVVTKIYKHPWFLWFLCPLFLYWITRLWFLARRRTMADDPVVFATTDRVSLIVGAITFGVFVAASL
jgi:4-hydroxybenzoate polyprenyltransferase